MTNTTTMNIYAEIALYAAAVIGAVAGIATYNNTAETCELRRDITFTGDPVVTRHCVGKLHLSTKDSEIVYRGYWGDPKLRELVPNR